MQSDNPRRRVFDDRRLGRGSLGSLSEDNFEYGAWRPMDDDKAIVSKTGEAAVAEAKSDDVPEASLYYPLSEAVEVRPRQSRQVEERSATVAGNTDATGKRSNRDGEREREILVLHV